MMSLEDSINLVMEAFAKGENGDIYVQKSPAATIEDIAIALLKIFKKNNKIKIIGPRHSEKIHESLCSSEEMAKVLEDSKYLRVVADLRNINYDLQTNINKIPKVREAYSSNNTYKLNIEEIIKLLKKQKFDFDF